MKSKPQNYFDIKLNKYVGTLCRFLGVHSVHDVRRFFVQREYFVRDNKAAIN